jgi:hypothetical protein
VIIDQIQDLLQPAVATSNCQPEFETPFTAIAKEDSLRFASGADKSQKAKSPAIKHEDGSPHEQGSSTAPRTDSQTLHNPLEPAPEPQLIEDTATPQLQAKKPLVSGSGSESAIEPPPEDRPGGAATDGARYEPGEHSARRGVEQLQEIFMVDEPLDGRRVALLVRQFPGVNGALILLEGGAVLGGQLPHWLNLEAALQAPEALAHFIRFIVELEAGQTPQSRLVTVTSATTITLVHSGKIVLLVSHHSRKLPPGLQHRLTETAQALNLIYGDACS